MAETEAIEQALAVRDLAALRDLAFQPGGFGQDDALRLRCWGALVAVDFESLPPLDVATAAETSSHGDRSTVAKDVNRSLWAAGERRGWSEKVRNKRRRALARVVNATFDSSQHYYQGFHDVAAAQQQQEAGRRGGAGAVHCVGATARRPAPMLKQR